MGLTGIIYSAAIKLKPIKSAYIDQITYKSPNLKETLDLFVKHSDPPYSVAWIDCTSSGDNLGRSLLMTGKHADHGKLDIHHTSRISVPVDLPSFTLNAYSIKAFNTLYYHKVQQTETHATIHYDSFFYPLDGINNWNRMYGKNGFTQYQFVIPKSAGSQAMDAILRNIVKSKKGSFLAVLKAFGENNNNLLSFPMEGYTLALDFKIEPDLFPFLDSLDALVLDYGGKLYLTKDSRMSADTFRNCYPAWEQFQKIRVQYGTLNKFVSLQSKRLELD
jgi:decaprenylphospho-beta-D-ribofuranose 2-oxidase